MYEGARQLPRDLRISNDVTKVSIAEPSPSKRGGQDYVDGVPLRGVMPFMASQQLAFTGRASKSLVLFLGLHATFDWYLDWYLWCVV